MALSPGGAVFRDDGRPDAISRMSDEEFRRLLEEGRQRVIRARRAEGRTESVPALESVPVLAGAMEGSAGHEEPESLRESVPEPSESVPAGCPRPHAEARHAKSVPEDILTALDEEPLSGKALVRKLGRKREVVLAALHRLVASGAFVAEGKGRAARFRLAATAQERAA